MPDHRLSIEEAVLRYGPIYDQYLDRLYSYATLTVAGKTVPFSVAFRLLAPEDYRTGLRLWAADYGIQIRRER